MAPYFKIKAKEDHYKIPVIATIFKRVRLEKQAVRDVPDDYNTDCDESLLAPGGLDPDCGVDIMVQPESISDQLPMKYVMVPTYFYHPQDGLVYGLQPADCYDQYGNPVYAMPSTNYHDPCNNNGWLDDDDVERIPEMPPPCESVGDNGCLLNEYDGSVESVPKTPPYEPFEGSIPDIIGNYLDKTLDMDFHYDFRTHLVED